MQIINAYLCNLHTYARTTYYFVAYLILCIYSYMQMRSPYHDNEKQDYEY